MKKSVIICLVLLTLSVSVQSAEIRVYDANDDFVGVLIGSTSEYKGVTPSINVFVPSVKKIIWLSASNEYLMTDGVTFYYTTPDCTGQPYAKAAGSDHLRYRILSWCPDDKIYMRESDGFSGETRQIVASKSFPDWPESCVCNTTTEPLNLETVRVIDVTTSLPFSYPMAMPLRFEYTPTNVITETKTEKKVVVVPLLD